MDAAVLFEKMCKIIEQSPQEINPMSYRAFIATLKPLTFKDNTLYLIAPSDMHRRHLMTVTMMHAFLISALNIVIDSPGADVILVLESEAASIMDSTIQEKASIPHPMLNERYTFENFVIGPGNHFAYAAALSVAEAPATINNPLFIYGGVGLGKTHLMHAIGNHILEYKPDTKVLYITCEKYTNEYIRAISKHQIDLFRDKFRENVDVLMIDDIQFLTNKERIQEEIFHNINDLFASNKQIILSSDRPPKSIQTLSDRLCSRFEGGLLVDITPPDVETRAAILRKKAEMDKVEVDDNILLYIAEKASDNVRELEGALKRITVFASTTGQPITLDLASKVLREYNAEVQKHCTPEMIITTVADYFGLTPEDILGPRRDKPIVHPRHIAYYLCRELTSLSNKRIGDEFNGRDHATIINGIGKIRTQLKTDAELKNAVEDITMRLRGE
jgi:chromosomal replication initiator protein